MSALERILHYHSDSKHQREGYAPAPGFLDWDSQPDPFSRFDGAPLIELPLLEACTSDIAQIPYSHIFDESRPAHSWTIRSLGTFLGLALGLSAWKSLGPDRWSLRMNPSSGNLHPTEAYVVSWADDPVLSPGIYHYAPLHHGLEQRARFSEAQAEGLREQFPGSEGAVALSSISWREEWKYGARAFRYCQLDVGHALGTLASAAGVMGWQMAPALAISDADLSALLGLERAGDFGTAEREEPDGLWLLGSGACNLPEGFEWPVPDVFAGQANKLSPERLAWPEVRQAKKACLKTQTVGLINKRPSPQPPVLSEGRSALDVLTNRRSAQRMDKASSAVSQDDWFALLSSLTPQTQPFQVLPLAGHVACLLMVHHVIGVEPGLYFLERTPGQADRLRPVCDPDFAWQALEDCPGLYALKPGLDVRKAASSLSCHQGIGGHGAFAMCMLADFTLLYDHGAWAYRDLHHEAGLIGQCLYQGAENIGLNGTGIGCFFDDEVLEMLGIPEGCGDWQVIYHFTIGKARPDLRLTIEPPYGHLDSRRANTDNRIG